LCSLSWLSASLRRLLARGMRDEGESISVIAETFEVSRQRVSTLLQP
jgi:predicted transcriptional regulator